MFKDEKHIFTCKMNMVMVFNCLLDSHSLH